MPFFAYHSCALTFAFKFDCGVFYMMLFEHVFYGLFGLLRSFFKGLIVYHYMR